MNKPLFPEVIVNGEAIPAAAIAAEAQLHPAPQGKPGLAWHAAARALALRALLLQEARRRGLAAAPAELAPGRVEAEEEALIRALLEAEIDIAPPGEAELRAAWQRDPARFRSPELWEASHILCAADPADAEARAKAERRAIALARSLGPAGEGFDRLVAESDCPSRANGGRLGQLGPGDTVPEFEAALRRLIPGEVSAEPVETRFGFHILRLDAHEPGRALPYEAVRPRLAAALEKAAWARAASALAGRLAARAEIVGVDLQPAG